MAAPVEGAAFDFKVRAQVPVVVDFSVVDEHITPAGRMHGLLARRGEVQDRQTSMGQGQASGRLRPDAGVIGAAMLNSARHPLGYGGRRCDVAPESGNATH